MDRVAQIEALSTMTPHLYEGVRAYRDGERLASRIGRIGLPFSGKHARDVHLQWNTGDATLAIRRAHRNDASEAGGLELLVSHVGLSGSPRMDRCRGNEPNEKDHAYPHVTAFSDSPGGTCTESLAHRPCGSRR